MTEEQFAALVYDDSDLTASEMAAAAVALEGVLDDEDDGTEESPQ